MLRPGGLFIVLDWGDEERPVGPPLGHVLGLATVREIIAKMGLDVVEAYEPGDLLPHHLALVAERPRTAAAALPKLWRVDRAPVQGRRRHPLGF